MKLWRSRVVNVQTPQSKGTANGASNRDWKIKTMGYNIGKREAKLKRLIEIVEAMEGKPCPTDAQFSDLLGYQNTSSASLLIRMLYERGTIKNTGTRRRRRLYVIASKKQTDFSQDPRL